MTYIALSLVVEGATTSTEDTDNKGKEVLKTSACPELKD